MEEKIGRRTLQGNRGFTGVFEYIHSAIVIRPVPAYERKEKCTRSAAVS
jgi:hypothetical protein